MPHRQTGWQARRFPVGKERLSPRNCGRRPCVHTHPRGGRRSPERQSRHSPSVPPSSRAPAAFPVAELGAPRRERIKAALGIVMHSPGAAMGFTGVTVSADIRSEYLHWISVSVSEVGLIGATASAFRSS